MPFRIALLGTLIFVAGCSESPYDDFYQPARPTLKFEPTEDVQIRIVNSDQAQQASTSTRTYLDKHNLAPEDLSPEDALQIRTLQLTAFRVQDNPSSIACLGISRFIDKEAGSPDDSSLLRFAKHRGADFVIFSTHFLGTRDGYASIPITSISNNYGIATVPSSFGTRTVNVQSNGYSTTYVPMPVKYEQWETIAILYRRISPAELAALDAQRPKPRAH